MKGYKTGGRQKGTPNKITSEIRDRISVLVSGTMDDIDISKFTNSEKIKLLQVLCQYIIPKLQSSDFNIGSDEGQSAVTIKFVDSSGRDISHQKQEEIKNLQELDENDLGLAHDFNKIFNS